MKTINDTYKKMVANVPNNIKKEVDLEVALSNKIDTLMKRNKLGKKEFAKQIGKNPSEITKWLSGQHNFTIKTIAEISSFFNKPLINVK